MRERLGDEKNNEEQNLADSWVLLHIFAVGADDKNLPTRAVKIQ